jgi:hypothetical protein
MKKSRRNRPDWYQPPPPPAVAVFRCRACSLLLTTPLTLLTDLTQLSIKDKTSFVPEGHYWLVSAEQDFAGQIAVPLASIVEPHYHSERERLSGCCGPSGTGGMNRVCACGQEIGTERSDCIWPYAVYLHTAQIVIEPVSV